MGKTFHRRDNKDYFSESKKQKFLNRRDKRKKALFDKTSTMNSFINQDEEDANIQPQK